MIFDLDLPPLRNSQATAAARLRAALDTLTSGRTDAARIELEHLLKDLEEQKC